MSDALPIAALKGRYIICTWQRPCRLFCIWLFVSGDGQARALEQVGVAVQTRKSGNPRQRRGQVRVSNTACLTKKR
jgi:hypothetical protein